MRLPLRELFRLPAAVWRFSGALFTLAFVGPYGAVFVQYSALRLYGATASGILQSAIGISLSVRALVGTAHAVLLTPHVNRQGDSAQRMAWANEFQRNTVLLFLLGLPPLLLFPDIALRALYSGRFVDAAAYVPLFIAAEVVGLLSGTYQALIIAGDRMLFHVIQNFIAQALLVGVAAVALPRLGLAGAGLSALSAPLFMFFSTLLFLRLQFGVHASREAALMALLTVAILLGCGIVGSRFVGVSAGLLGAKATGCVGVWLASYLLMPAEDRSRLRSGLARGRKELMARLAPPPAN